MNDQPRINDDARHADESADRRRPYHPPTLQRHAKLPVITAGSISESQWQFSGDNEYQET